MGRDLPGLEDWRGEVKGFWHPEAKGVTVVIRILLLILMCVPLLSRRVMLDVGLGRRFLKVLRKYLLLSLPRLPNRGWW